MQIRKLITGSIPLRRIKKMNSLWLSLWYEHNMGTSYYVYAIIWCWCWCVHNGALLCLWHLVIGLCAGNTMRTESVYKKPRNACLEFLSTIIIIDTIYADVANFCLVFVDYHNVNKAIIIIPLQPGLPNCNPLVPTIPSTIIIVNVTRFCLHRTAERSCVSWRLSFDLHNKVFCLQQMPILRIFVWW